MGGLENFKKFIKESPEKLGATFKTTPTPEEDAVKQVKEQFDLLYQQGLDNNRLASSKEDPKNIDATELRGAVKALKNARWDIHEREKRDKEEETPIWPDTSSA